MSTRAQRSAERRRTWHESKLLTAGTPRARLWAACGWLASEASRAGSKHLDDATEMVLTRVHKIRKEADGCPR
jgi:hypothetical protein